MPRISVLAIVGLSLLALGVFALSPDDDAQAATITVNVGNEWFCNPGDSACQTIDSGDIDVTSNIAVGDTVQWQWVVEATHTITECAGGDLITCPSPHLFDSSFQSTGSFSHTFTTAGTFSYRCEVHPDTMRGQVIVAAQATATSTPTATATQAGSVTPAASRNATPAAIPAAAPGTGGDPSSAVLSWATLLVVAGAILVGGSAVFAVEAIRRL